MSEAARAQGGLCGHLHLYCARDERGRSILRRQSFRAPFHISKPHFDAETLVVNIANPTAGLLQGDLVEVRVEVASGSRLLLTTPAANRVFRMAGGVAQAEQRFEVAAGGWLEFWPEVFIPHAGAHYRQRTEIVAQAGAELFFVEALAPGRVASGEAFAYTRLEWEMKLSYEGKLAALERYTLEPGTAPLEALRSRFPEAYYASAFLITTRLGQDHPCWREMLGWQTEDLWIGVSPLVCGGWVIKLLGAGALALRSGLARTRAHVYAALGRQEPALRRITGE